MKRAEIIRYFLDEYFSGDTQDLCDATGYRNSQIRDWLNGSKVPQKKTIEYIIHCTLAPEFKVVVEFSEFSPNNSIKPQLRSALDEYCNHPGIYAFYDSMAKLLYIGKATSLLDEIYQSMRQNISVKFPNSVRSTPTKRYEVIRYFSAYDVGDSYWVDYPRHVESLILRISKPPLNKISGNLERLT